MDVDIMAGARIQGKPQLGSSINSPCRLIKDVGAKAGAEDRICGAGDMQGGAYIPADILRLREQCEKLRHEERFLGRLGKVDRCVIIIGPRESI